MCRKIISNIVVLSLIISIFSFPSFAEGQNMDLSEDLGVDEIEAMVSMIVDSNSSIDEEYAIDAADFIYETMNSVTAVNNEEGCAELEVEFGNTEGTIAIVEANQQEVQYAICEDEREHIVLLKDDGKIFLDGNQVEYYEENPEVVGLDKGYRNTTTCPYGEESDYSVKVIDGEKLGYVNITSGAVAAGSIVVALILASFNPPAFVTVAAAIIPNIISYWAGENLNPKYISIKKYEYEHTKGWIVKNGMAVDKRIFKFYPSKNYTGKCKNTKKSYRVFTW